ncbi:Lipoprotein releasing system, transmembrane protein, LolC/E family [Candidatus Sulfotelmatobacter kueseliae]|uniref:Lipoprotein releasing system, transmembrane protein, LolC/E family n=1 Tax=Candidatus Sulfotelmatobacter kueseliae TaxID=2042962 RepID=A0A2U3KZW2_9BACT|nr:Lipoprotein releasing system, transmembrane protein, LolC/E family [Candidatus Sulfotelmatobacter kueseliae]
MRFELFIASRYLRAKRRQAFIGIITAISIAGVAAGVASLVIALAINNGFRQDLQQRLLGSTSHISLLRIADDGIKGWPALMDRLAKQPHVVAAAPAIFEQVLISRGPRARGAVLKGMIPRYERRVGDLLTTVKEGSAEALEDNGENSHGSQNRRDPSAGSGQAMGHPAEEKSDRADEASAAPQSPDSLEAVEQRVAAMPPIVLGQDMADNLGATVGSIVLVTSPQGELTPFGMVPKYSRFRVVGIFNSGFYDYDSAWAFARLSDAQQLFGLGDLISVIEFKVDDIYRADVISHELEDAAGKGFMATNWMEQNKALFRALRLERVVTFITIGLIVFVAALNILISLIMMVMEKTKDIAVLMSMGTRQSQVRNVFMAQGVLIGVIGTALGLVLGYALSYAAGHYHIISLSPEVYSIDYVPFAARAVDGVIVALVAVGISFVATLYPSWSASRILPAEALRYE